MYDCKATASEIIFFIDQNPDFTEYCGVPIFQPGEISLRYSADDMKNYFPIIGISQMYYSDYGEIEKKLRVVGTCGVIWNYFDYVRYLFINNRQKILNTVNYFCDDRSQEIFVKTLEGFCSMDTSKFPIADNHSQYFPDDIPLKSGYSRFVDCGAFDGDTFTTLLQKCHNIELYIAFEPDNASFRRLVEKVTHSQYHNPAIIIPCALHSGCKSLRFSSNNSSSSISHAGEFTIQCMSIDEVFHQVHPTFIKMDIEGTETEAIIGARETLKSNHPDLAICVYHHPEDIYRIPLLLKEIVPQYQLYLRTYSSNGFETVLYATTLEQRME